MKKYNVEIKDWHEAEPDNGIWDGDCFQDPVESETEEEAIEIAMDCYVDDSNLYDEHEDLSVDYETGCITWTEEEYKVGIIFRAVEINV